MLSYSFSGMAMSFCGINWLLKRKYIHVTPLMINLSTLCFGVYIYQQFILKIIYYQLDGLTLVTPWLLPWTGLLITLILSLLLSHYTLKTRLGKFLIG